MIFDLSEDLDIERAKSKLSFFIKKKVKINLTQKRLKTSRSQLNYLHVILSFYGLELGYTLEEVKQDIFKRIINKDIFLIEKKGLIVCRSINELNTLETTQAIERFRNYSIKEQGIYLPEPNENEILQRLEDESKRYGNREYL